MTTFDSLDMSWSGSGLNTPSQTFSPPPESNSSHNSTLTIDKEEAAVNQIKAHGMDLSSSLQALAQALGGAHQVDTFYANKVNLLNTFSRNEKNIELLYVSLTDLVKCLQHSYISGEEFIAIKSNLLTSFVGQSRQISPDGSLDYLEELSKCHYEKLVSNEEFALYSQQVYTAPPAGGSMGFFPTSKNGSPKTAHMLPPGGSQSNTQQFDASGNYSPQDLQNLLYMSQAGYGFNNLYSRTAPGKKGLYAPGLMSSQKSDSKPGAKKDKKKPATDPKILKAQIIKMNAPLPQNIPDQQAPPSTHRGFGASAKPFNQDGSIEVSESRKHWRCKWCYCSGKFTPALRKGPAGAKTLCNSCGMYFARRGFLPEERYREFIGGGGGATAASPEADFAESTEDSFASNQAGRGLRSNHPAPGPSPAKQMGLVMSPQGETSFPAGAESLLEGFPGIAGNKRGRESDAAAAGHGKKLRDL